MKLQIDIKTPAGQSLEGFPITFNKDLSLSTINNQFCFYNPEFTQTTLHPGDTVTITVL